MKKFFLAGLVLVGGCATTHYDIASYSGDREQAISAAHEGVSKGMRDPDSAKFRNEKVVQATSESGEVYTRVCGEVNATNGYGGYVGYTRYVYDIERDKTAIMPVDIKGGLVGGPMLARLDELCGN